ncbi:MAG: WYL domain-containing protein [Holophaga sp.]|nr:WYL domain-containing protein [Holophaga sp.]
MAPRKQTTTQKLLDGTLTKPEPAAIPAPKKAPKATPKTAKAAPKKASVPEPEAIPEAAVVPAIKSAPKAAAGRKKTPLAIPAPAEKIADSIPTPIALPTPVAMAAPAPVVAEGFTDHARTILEAISTGKAVEFIFKDGDSNPPRTFEARQLVFDIFTGAWFAWGWDRRYNAERHHRLELLAEINIVEGPGRSAQGPFADGTPANQIGGWRGGEPIPVKAVLQKQWIFAVKQSPAPFPDFLIEDIEDGKAQISFTATDLRAIARWCMQFGDGILVQEPQRLVDRIKQVGVAWAGKMATPPAAPQAKPQPSRHEPKHESKHEAKQEARPEPKPEAKHEARRPEPPRKEVREHRDARESEAPKAAKPGRIEVRIERL